MFFRENYSFLSNLNNDYSFMYKDIVFDSSERAYFWEKTDDEYEKNKILSLPSSLACKKYKIKSEIKDWNSIKVSIMTKILYAKYNCNADFKQKLDLVKENIVESNAWHDNYWGDCVCNKLKYPKYGVKKDCNYPGKNNLGIILNNLKKSN